jgi:endonuclease/exonuclease/phosphatase family metal-dependent hydrolase
MKYLIIIFLFAFVHGSTVRVMTYNLLNFSDEDDREDDFIQVIDFIDPDLIIVEEVVGQTGYSKFRSDVLDNIGQDIWSSAPFTNQSAQQDIALYYHHDDFTFMSTNVVYTAQSSGTRDVIEWVLVHVQSGVEFKVYGAHFKASSGNSNAAQRLEEATVLRDYLNNLPQDSRFIVGGDFNIYSNNSSSEPAFEMLTGSSSNDIGRLFDPIDRIGAWHNNSSYSDVHTQSTRTTSFGGGATGGLDDRFDWLFVSESLLNSGSSMYYEEESYTAFGNDGNHFNDPINQGENSEVSNEMANALHNASDHLPVYMDLYFDDLEYADIGIVITEVMVNPAAVSDSYGEWFEIYNTSDTAINIDGWSITDNNNDVHVISSDTPVISNEYFVLGRNSDSSLNGGLDIDYEYNGLSFSNNTDALILSNNLDEIVDEVYYNSSWPFSSGGSMEIHNTDIDNAQVENWYTALLTFGDGDSGSPGGSFEISLNNQSQTNIPEKFMLFPPWPNPFNPVTTIKFKLEPGNSASLKIFDISGRVIKTIFEDSKSFHISQVNWYADDLPSGVYIIKLSSAVRVEFQKVVLVK